MFRFQKTWKKNHVKAVLRLCFSSWMPSMWTGASAADTGSAIRVFNHYGRVKEWGTDQSWLSAGSSRPKTDKHNHPTLQSPQRLHYWKQSERIRQRARVNQKDFFLFFWILYFLGWESKSESLHTRPQLKPAGLCRWSKREREREDLTTANSAIALPSCSVSGHYYSGRIWSYPASVWWARRATASGNRRRPSRGQLLSFCCCPSACSLDKIISYGPLCSFGSDLLHTNQVWESRQGAVALIAGSVLQKNWRHSEANRLLAEHCFRVQWTLRHIAMVHLSWQVCPLSPAGVMKRDHLQFAIRTKRGQSHTVKERPWPWYEAAIKEREKKNEHFG